MGRYELDEVEADEVYHALMGRKMDLDKTAKSLEEKEGLPEAAAQVRNRIERYMPNGEGKASRPGLLRLFAPQRDIEAEAAQGREERDANGQQDAFGGGGETGGGHPAGEIVPGAGATTKRGRKGKTKVADDQAAAPAVDVEYEVIPEGRRLGGPTTPTLDTLSDAGRDALNRLEGIAANLLDGPATIDAGEFTDEAVRVLELMPSINPGIDLAIASAHLTGEYRDSPENAHHLAYYVKRQTDALRDEPPAPAAGLSFAEPEPAAINPDDPFSDRTAAVDGGADPLVDVPADAAP